MKEPDRQKGAYGDGRVSGNVKNRRNKQLLRQVKRLFWFSVIEEYPFKPADSTDNRRPPPHATASGLRQIRRSAKSLS
ncbi:hypothetical protein [Paenibacillus sinensis]|uniref:hypothetical protein n=1 Tax=Paenibacillus sinensis TaxID=2834413 RepID=UPI001CA7D099|nr:hypothetical protein [Paenibacillus sinensis]